MAGTVIIGLPNIPSAIALAGYGEANLKFLSQQTGANLVLRGQELLVSGKEQHVDLAVKIVQSLEELWSTGNNIASADILTARQAIEGDRRGNCRIYNGIFWLRVVAVKRFALKLFVSDNILKPFANGI